MSPRVLESNGLTAYIYFKDHNPPHVHVYKAGAEAVFRISDLEVVHNNGFSAKAIGRIQTWLAINIDSLTEAWNEIAEES